jgi:hypothetical protein
VRSSIRVWAAAAAVFLVSVSLKLVAAPPPTNPDAQAENLHRFLATTRAEGIEGVPVGRAGPPWGGWRFRVAGCRAAVFPSGQREHQDLLAHNRTPRGDRIEYVYRGRLRTARPTWPLAVDMIAYRLAAPFRASREPSYVVLSYSKDCGAPPDLPWNRLPPI